MRIAVFGAQDYDMYFLNVQNQQLKHELVYFR